MITGLALINEIEDRLGWPQSKTIEGSLPSETRKLVRLLNRVLSTMQTLDDWPMLRTDGTLQFIPAETGTWDAVLIHQNVPNLVIQDTDFKFDESYVGRAIQLGSEATVYRIEEIINDQGVRLNRPWTGDTIYVDELDYKIVQDRYNLPQDFDRPTGGWDNFFGSSSIDPVGPNKFSESRQARGNTVIIGDPDTYTIYGMDPTMTYQTIRFDPYPENQRVLNYTYQRNHPAIETDQDRVLYPRTHEAAILETILQLAYRDYEDSAKSESVLRDMIRTLNQAQGPGGVAQDRLSFSPNGRHRIAQHRRWRGGSRVDWGASFDDANKIGFR